MKTKIDWSHWVRDSLHLPKFLRDFHDQKEIFKTINHLLPNHKDSTENITWIQGHCYVIDKFLRFMAIHGCTLQKSKANVRFLDLNKSIREFQDYDIEILKMALTNRVDSDKV